MKHVLIASVAVLFGLAPVVGQAQSEPSVGPVQTTPAGKAHALKLGLLGNWNRGVMLSYERQLGAHSSLQGGVAYWKSSYRGFTRTNLHEISVELTYRRYLQSSKPVLIGWYAAGGVVYLGNSFSRGSASSSEDWYHDGQALKLNIGRQFQLGQRFTFDINLGPSMAFAVIRPYKYDPQLQSYQPAERKKLVTNTGLAAALQFGYRL
ncbi:DUF3575 domain-containing protein [Hymenobacter oligotrophus]|uniref:DUF3575 domain-containing protein n=1 Tax=Hymenobacter oligotrophus TaxID=2319843 RepID=A0A3B7QX26_9BACT|nr:DUF3575 domain-containing protein [Hymenobacter oligotrophus]AYA36364.1 DUF3575 domain-containing protein [Hymenobacter oligotrophus]